VSARDRDTEIERILPPLAERLALDEADVAFVRERLASLLERLDTIAGLLPSESDES